VTECVNSKAPVEASYTFRFHGRGGAPWSLIVCLLPQATVTAAAPSQAITFAGGPSTFSILMVGPVGVGVDPQLARTNQAHAAAHEIAPRGSGRGDRARLAARPSLDAFNECA
jgi:hypothetical protein